MTLDDYFRDQISRGQPPTVALHNAAQAYAAKIKLEYRRPDCSQYADETQAWDEPEKSLVDEFLGTEEGRRQTAYEKLKYEREEAVELLREARRLLEKASDRPIWTAQEIDWVIRVDKFLEGKQ